MVDRDEDDEEPEEVVVVGWMVALVLSMVSGKSVLKWTRKNEPLAEVSLRTSVPVCECMSGLFGPIAEERAGTSKSYCGVNKVRPISGQRQTCSKVTLGTRTSLRDMPSDQAAHRHSSRK